MLGWRWSPQQISATLRRVFPCLTKPSIPLSMPMPGANCAASSSPACATVAVRVCHAAVAPTAVARFQRWAASTIGVENGSRRPRPPNRTCGSPAYGSPVGSYLIGIVSLQASPYAWRTGQLVRRRLLASVDDHYNIGRSRDVSPACAIALAIDDESAHLAR